MTATAYYVGNPIEQTTHKDRFSDNWSRDIMIECRGNRDDRFDISATKKTWAVVYCHRTWSRTLHMAAERQPSSRTDRYLNDYRHTLEDAQKIALALLARETKEVQKEFDQRFGTEPYIGWKEAMKR